MKTATQPIPYVTGQRPFDRMHAKPLIDILQHNGTPIVPFGTGNEAAEYVSQHRMVPAVLVHYAVSPDGGPAISKKIAAYGPSVIGVAASPLSPYDPHNLRGVEEEFLGNGAKEVIITPVPAADLAALVRRHINSNTARIIWADDEQPQRAFGKHYLGNLVAPGVSIETVEDGEALVAAVKNYHDRKHWNPRRSLIITDRDMPGYDGLEATRRIRQFDSKTPIVLVTANLIDEEARNAGANGLLTKPYKGAAAIKQMLETYRPEVLHQ